MADNNDYYQILGVNKDASGAEIKKAYRKKALKWHPDRNDSKEAEKKFKAINEAYQVLSNKEKRRAYDQFGAAAFQNGGNAAGGQRGPFRYTYTNGNDFNFNGFTDPFEIFESFFGGASPFTQGRRSARKPTYQITISLKEAVTGAKKEFHVNKEKRKVKIPAGVQDGSRIRLSDFYLLVNVSKDRQFSRRGNDLIVSKKIAFSKAALGGEVKLKNIDNEEIKFRIKPGTDSGKMVRLRGYGVPFLRSSGRGDLYVKLEIKTPDKLSAKQKKLLKELNL